MREDIVFPKLEGVGVFAIPKESDGMVFWHVSLLNMLNEKIENVLISTKGYGRQQNEKVETSELRHFFETVEMATAQPIEVVPSKLIGLSNQYWVSFYIGSKIYDKKFIFLPDTLLEKNLTPIDLLGEQGILII
jgi:hypothetical protein